MSAITTLMFLTTPQTQPGQSKEYENILHISELVIDFRFKSRDVFFFFLGGGGGGGIRCIMGNLEVANWPFIFLSLVTVPVPFSLLKWRKAKIAFIDTN